MSVKRRYRMVVALDDSEYSEIVLEHALDLAVRHDKTDLHFVRIVEHERDVEAAGRKLASLLLEAFDTIRDTPGERRARLHIRVGNTVEEIIRVAADFDADMLVVGRFGAHSRHRSFASAIVDQSPCPTLIVGLSEHAVETTPQCEACVQMRESTDGEVWFCAEHRGDQRIHSSTLMPFAGSSHGRLW